jgi:hypothetical protein
MLDANGIVAVVSSDDAGGIEPQLQVTQGVRVLVAPEDAERARALLADADDHADADADDDPTAWS